MSAVKNLFQDTTRKALNFDGLVKDLDEKKAAREDADKLQNEALDRAKKEEEARIKAEEDAKASVTSPAQPTRRRQKSVFAGSAFDRSYVSNPLGGGAGKKTLLGF